MNEEERLSKSVAVVAARVGMVADEVMTALFTAFDLVELTACRRWITTGAGASEGPARLLAMLLRGQGIAADYVPISAFIAGPPPADVCVIVSQRLSPNARVPLAHASAYVHMLLVTTVEDDAATAAGARLLKHGPCDEDGLLLRLIGPAAANATVINVASVLGGEVLKREQIAIALSTAHERAEAAMAGIDPTALFDLVGFVAIGTDVSLCESLGHKVLEALGLTQPPIWDLCALVHGPLQSFYERTATLVVFERNDTPPDLTNRLARVLHPTRHRLVRLRSGLPGPLALVDFDLQVDHVLLAALRARPRDLVEWPGKGHDAPLYDLGSAQPF